MKKIVTALLLLSAAVLPLSGGVEKAMTEKDFQLGDIECAGGKLNVSHKDGIFTVVVPKQLGLSNETRGADLLIPLEKLSGKGIQIRAEMRWEEINFEPGNPHCGGKILVMNEKAGIKNFFVTAIFKGTQKEWQPVTLYCDFPAGVEVARIVFGIQQGWGKLEFRNVSIEEFPIAPITNVKVPEGFKQEYTDRILKDVPRRGVMSPCWSNLTEKDLADLASWGANLIRYQIVDGHIKDPTNEAEYEKWFKAALDHLEELMPTLEKYDIKVIVDMHYVAGGRYNKRATKDTDASHFRAMHEEKYKALLIRCWEQAARQFKNNNKMIYAYDIFNEPIQHGAVPYSFWDLQYEAAKAIRAIDPETPVMVESNHMANPTFFEMEPMPLKNIIYSVHMYAPGDYTHQGVNDTSYTKQYYAKAYNYRDSGWDRARLAGAMKSVREFQKKYGAKIQVGEFSVAVWAPGGADYLNDLVSIFEEYHWDWTYHAFREWEGWSLEHEGTPDNIRPAKKDTDRKQVMLKYFNKDKTK